MYLQLIGTFYCQTFQEILVNFELFEINIHHSRLDIYNEIILRIKIPPRIFPILLSCVY